MFLNMPITSQAIRVEGMVRMSRLRLDRDLAGLEGLVRAGRTYADRNDTMMLVHSLRNLMQVASVVLSELEDDPTALYLPDADVEPRVAG